MRSTVFKRSRPGLGACVALMGVALGASAQAQIANSSNYQMQGLMFDGGGGGSCSLDSAAWVSLGALGGHGLSSLSFGAELGFLPYGDAEPGNDPVLFGVTPDFGPKAGGTPITISGLNFDKFGSGTSIAVKIGGLPATSVVVNSNSQITAVTPAGISGPRTVEVSNTFGLANDPDGYLYTPAITTTPVVPLGGTLEMRNYGPVGAAYVVFVSTSTAFAPTPYGPLLIGPSPFIQLTPILPYPPADGISQIDIVVPVMPVLHGLVAHFQALSVTVPLALSSFTNASTTAIP
jgi:IPT/TIG domain